MAYRRHDNGPSYMGALLLVKARHYEWLKLCQRKATLCLRLSHQNRY